LEESYSRDNRAIQSERSIWRLGLLPRCRLTVS